jgi:hypothetical protein
MAGNTGTPGATVVGRIMAILGAFGERHPRLTLSEVAPHRVARAGCGTSSIRFGTTGCAWA